MSVKKKEIMCSVLQKETEIKKKTNKEKFQSIEINFIELQFLTKEDGSN